MSDNFRYTVTVKYTNGEVKKHTNQTTREVNAWEKQSLIDKTIANVTSKETSR